jgi:adenylate cyclase
VSADEVVKLLDEIFSAFDLLAEKCGLEKIKTIGDAYMAASGIPAARADHVKAAAEFCLDMMKEMERFNRGYHTSITLRVGIHTGPVIAGIIGRNKFIYDLWGDTVNTASRMESHSTPGRIQVTRSVYEALGGEYSFEKRGAIEVKGKGKMETYFLEGRKRVGKIKKTGG